MKNSIPWILSTTVLLLLIGGIAGVAPGWEWIQGLLAGVALLIVLLAGFLALLAAAQEQERAEGLLPPDRPQTLSRLDRAKLLCLPMVSLSGLLTSTVVAVVAFALLCDALFDLGLDDWFKVRVWVASPPPLWEWIWFSLSQAVRAADLPDLIESRAVDLGMEISRWVAPIQGRHAGSATLIGLFRLAIGTLLVSQVLSLWSRDRRIRRAVRALREADTRENAKRTLILNGRRAARQLRRVFCTWSENGEVDWLLAALEVCRGLGDDAAALEADIRSVMAQADELLEDAERAEAIQQAAIRCLASVTGRPEELVHRIDEIWEAKLDVPDERLAAWKGALGTSIAECRRRLDDGPAETRQRLLAELRPKACSEPCTWLRAVLDKATRQPTWPLVVMRPDSERLEILAPEAAAALQPRQIRREPLEETIDPLREHLREALEEYAGRAGLPPRLRIALDDTALAFRLVPAGAYWRGNLHDEEEGDAVELPPHPVRLRSPFFLQQSQVTVRQFEAYLESADEAPVGEELLEVREALRDRSESRDHPMPYVSWKAARGFCDWLMEDLFEPVRAALPELADRVLATLPTEAEWEWAAKGPALWQFPWGNEIDEERLRFFVKPYDAEVPKTVPVGSYPAGVSWCGLDDMAGNLFCWCDDQAEVFDVMDRDAFNDDPMGITIEPQRMQRGGAWCFTDWDARASYRYPIRLESSEAEDVGFRVALVFGRPRAL